MLNLKKVKEIDSKITFVLGYRQLINYMIFVVAVTAFEYGLYGESVIFLVFGAKWFLTQIYHNFDALETDEILVKERK